MKKHNKQPLPAALTLLSAALSLAARVTHAQPAAEPAAAPAAEPAAPTATTSAAQPTGEWRHSHALVLRYNPWGLQDESTLGYQRNLRGLYGASEDSRLFGKTYVTAGVIGRASPQFAQVGGFVKALPIALLELQASGVRTLPLTDAEAVRQKSYYTPGTLAGLDVTKPGAADSILTAGWQVNLQARLQAKVGSVAVRNTNLLTIFELEEKGTTGTFFDQTLDVITPFKSKVYQNDTDLLWADDSKPWVLGARWTWVRPLSDGTDPITRVGPMFAWKFGDVPPAPSANAHALVVLSQWHVAHRTRAGQEMSQSVPYFVLLYSMTGGL